MGKYSTDNPISVTGARWWTVVGSPCLLPRCVCGHARPAWLSQAPNPKLILPMSLNKSKLHLSVLLKLAKTFFASIKLEDGGNLQQSHLNGNPTRLRVSTDF